MSKNNIRSFRYSDKVAQILENYEGESFNAKFENLVLFCFDNIEQRQKELDRINEEIKKNKELLFNLRSRTSDVDRMIRDMETLKDRISVVSEQALSVGKRLKQQNNL